MKKNYAPILVVAFAMAAICTAVFYGLIAGRLGSGAQANAAPQVLVASSNIARGSTVSALNVKAADWVRCGSRRRTAIGLAGGRAHRVGGHRLR